MDEEIYQTFKEALEAMQGMYELLLDPQEAPATDRDETIRRVARHLRRMSYIINHGTRGIESQD